MGYHAPAGTMVAIVGDAADEALASLEGITGVETLSVRGGEPGLAGRRIAATVTPWVVHDADPLAHVAQAWIELFEERATMGALQAEVEDALARFASGEALMPDYYVVLAPEQAPDVWRHWWCGALGRHAPRRVLPVAARGAAGDESLRHLLTVLPPSRPWPDPVQWLPDLPFAIPDRVGLRA